MPQTVPYKPQPSCFPSIVRERLKRAVKSSTQSRNPREKRPGGIAARHGSLPLDHESGELRVFNLYGLAASGLGGSQVDRNPTPDDVRLLAVVHDVSNAQSGSTGGHLYLSLRVADTDARYGVSNSVSIYPISGGSSAMVLEDRVHIHFQRTGGTNLPVGAAPGVDVGAGRELL